MVIWEVTSDKSVAFYEMKGEAANAKRTLKKGGFDCEGPIKVVVRNRQELIELLGRAMQGRGTTQTVDEDDPASEFL